MCAAHQNPLDARRPTGMPPRLIAADRLAVFQCPSPATAAGARAPGQLPRIAESRRESFACIPLPCSPLKRAATTTRRFRQRAKRPHRWRPKCVFLSAKRKSATSGGVRLSWVSPHRCFALLRGRNSPKMMRKTTLLSMDDARMVALELRRARSREVLRRLDSQHADRSFGK